MSASAPDLAVVLAALNQASNLRVLLPAIAEVAKDLGIQVEAIVVDGGSADETVAAAGAFSARQESEGPEPPVEYRLLPRVVGAGARPIARRAALSG